MQGLWCTMNKLMIMLMLLTPVVAQAMPFSEHDATYPWLSTSGMPAKKDKTIRSEVPVPEGHARTETDAWGEWLRNLPALHAGAPVLLRNGQAKRNQDWQYRVINLDVLPFQECADSVLRLRAEYLLSRGQTFRFSGMSFSSGSRAAFDRFLGKLFVHKGTHNLANELGTPVDRRVLVGDMLVRGGSPGHVVMVVDVAQDRRGHRKLLLANGFMPAQDFHIVRHPKGGVWYDEQELRDGMYVPVGGFTFTWKDLRRF